MRWPIRIQLLLPLLTLLLGVIGMSTWTAIASAKRARTQIENQVREIARTLDEAEIPLNDVILQYLKGLSGAQLLFVGSDGSQLTSFPKNYLPLPPLEPVGEEIDWRNLHLGPQVTIQGESYLCSGVHLQLAKHTRPGGVAYQTLYILYPETLWRDALWEAIRPSLILGGFVGLASVALAVGVSQRLGHRIRELERRTRLIAAGDFSPMPLPGRQDELRDLGLSVNDMAAKLAELQETVQKTERLRLLGQLSGGLAHQLRNGIAGARLAVQLHLRECEIPSRREGEGEGEDNDEGEALQVALRQLSLLEANLRRFLALGHTGPPRREACSLLGVIQDVEMLLRPQCRHAGIDCQWRPPADDVYIQGDPDQLAQLFLNVMGNAVEAAGPGGWVSLSVKTREDSRHPGVGSEEKACTPAQRLVEIEVADSGQGPPATIADRVFEVFVTSKPEGVGLGLAVARQVAESHGGSIAWRRQNDTTCFLITLPVAENPPTEQTL